MADSSIKDRWKEREETSKEHTSEADMSEKMGFESFVANPVLNLVSFTSLTFSKIRFPLSCSFLTCVKGVGRCWLKSAHP